MRMDIVLDNRDNNQAKEDDNEMIPFFSIASRDFDKDLAILKKVLYQFEQRTHSAYKFSERATLLAAGWWFYDVFFKRDFIRKIFQLLLPPNFCIKTKRLPH